VISDRAQIQAISERFPFLQEGDESLAKAFFGAISLARVKSGETICHEGTQCTHLALVLSGCARVYKLSESGREITLYRVGPGESCILTASCIVNQRPFPAVAVCEDEIEAVIIPTHLVTQWFGRYPSWRSYIFNLISDRLGDVIAIVEEVAFRRVDRRIAAFLLARGDAEDALVIKTTHQEIASELGTSREVVSRILKDLESQACISVGRGSIRITDRDALRLKAEDV
jgi:CRP/FNR family transcriptional regulator